MSISLRLSEDLKNAMRSKDQDRTACIRQVRSKIQEAVNAPNFDGEVDDAFHVQVIGAYVKSLSKAIKELEAAGERSQALRDRYAAEIDYLQVYLPKLLGEEETAALVRQAIADLGVTDPKQAGRVMGVIMKAHRDDVDAALVRRLVDETLA